MNFWKNFKVLSRFTQKWIQPSACTNHGLYGHKPQSFPPNHAPKMPQSQQLFFGLRLLNRIFQHPAIQTKIVQPFGGFFQKIKVRQPIGRKVSIKPWSKPVGEVGFIFVWSGSELKLKNQKPCPFQGLPNGTTLIQIQSGRTVPLNHEKSSSNQRYCNFICMMKIGESTKVQITFWMFEKHEDLK